MGDVCGTDTYPGHYDCWGHSNHHQSRPDYRCCAGVLQPIQRERCLLLPAGLGSTTATLLSPITTLLSALSVAAGALRILPMSWG